MDNYLKIVNFLGKNIGKSFTMHGLSNLTNIPYASLYRAVQQIKDILDIEIVGNAKTVRLRTNKRVVKAYLIISSDEEQKEFLEKHLILRKITNELDTNDVIVLFGSYAKSKEVERSDIDILVVNKKGDKSLSFYKYELLFEKKINPIFVTSKEFKGMLKDKEENVGKQALKNHIILNNPDGFWEMVLDGI